MSGRRSRIFSLIGEGIPARTGKAALQMSEATHVELVLIDVRQLDEMVPVLLKRQGCAKDSGEEQEFGDVIEELHLFRKTFSKNEVE